MEICKQQSEIEMRDKREMEICKQQSEIKMRHLTAVDRFKRYGR